MPNRAKKKAGGPKGADFLLFYGIFCVLCAEHVLLHHLPEDGELLGGDEHVGKDENEPELLHILSILGEEEAVAEVGHGVDDEDDGEHGEKALSALLSHAGIEGENRVI